MLKRNNWLLPLCFSIIFFNGYSQNSSLKSYVIITYEQKFSKGFEGIKRTFWVVPEDSISNMGSKFFPLLMSGYYKNDIDSCCLGKEIDPYFSSSVKENYLLIAQEKALDNLQTIVFDKRRKIQSITKKWSSDKQEQIIIYATSIYGTFCFSKFNFTGQNRSGYLDLFYLPYSEIAVNDQFWNTTKGKLIMNLDFTKYNFNFNILYNTFPEWRKYGR